MPPARSSRSAPSLLLSQGIEVLGLDIAAPEQARLMQYLGELEKWNSAYNLSGVRDPAEMVTRHVLDSLALLPALAHTQPGAALLDVGSGAGLPGLVLALVRPDWAVSTLDSNGKKARFMRHAVRQLGLRNATVIESRVEDHEAPEGYARILSRAYASLAGFVASTAHLLAPGGEWVAMKGKLDGPELAALPPDCRIRETRRLAVPGLDEERHAVILSPVNP